MKGYVVEFGSYSDRSVSGVYSTEERAQIAAAPDGDVTEYEMDVAFDLYDKGLRPYSVEMHYDGSVRRVEKLSYWAETKAEEGMASTDNFPAQLFKWDCIRVTTWAKDEQHAIKITNEHRAERIAAGWNGIDHWTRTVAQ